MLAAFALAAGSSAFAEAAPVLPMEQHAGSVSYLSGGIGQEESEAIKRAAANYPLEVVLVEKSSQGTATYLADVSVEIRDDKGRIVLDTHAGPFLLARIAPGKYSITATFTGVTKRREYVSRRGGTSV